MMKTEIFRESDEQFSINKCRKGFVKAAGFTEALLSDERCANSDAYQGIIQHIVENQIVFLVCGGSSEISFLDAANTPHIRIDNAQF